MDSWLSTLWARASGRADGDAGVDELLRHLAGHSLALELAGAYLREYPEVTLAQYLDRLRAGIAVDDKVKDQVRYERTVQQAFDATWERLDGNARRALQIAGRFADEEASVTLLAACQVDEDALRARGRAGVAGEELGRTPAGGRGQPLQPGHVV